MKVRVDAELASELGMYDAIGQAEVVLVPGDENLLKMDAERYQEARGRPGVVIGTTNAEGDVELEPPPGPFSALVRLTKIAAPNHSGGLIEVPPQYMALVGVVGFDPREPRMRFARAAWHTVKRAADVWTVVGRVRGRGGKPISGVIVDVYDADVVRHDNLGSGMTDEAGRFRVDYREEQFKSGDIIYGPDLFFRITTPAGGMLLQESAIKGHTPGRANASVVEVIELHVEA